MDPLQAAAQSLKHGRVEEALAVLNRAGDTGSADALTQLAIWYLDGTVVARDLPGARNLLRRAAALGHADAALTEIALTANGSGAPADWQAAVQLLRHAAQSDPLAAQYLALLQGMALREDGTPRATPQPAPLHQHPRVERFAQFCTPDECLHIASLAAASLQPATVFDPASGKMVAHPIRTSDNAVIGPTRETLVVQALNQRIATATGMQVTQGEPLAILRYAPGQQYRPHLDTIAGESNQRVRTAILYLNHNYTGGETAFPLLNLMVTPQIGDLLVFDNVDARGAPDPLSRHAGLPVLSGTKWIATRWLRAEPISPWELSVRARAGG